MKVKHLSASCIKCLKQCQFKFFLEYVLKIRGKENYAANLGTLFHAIFEKFAKNELEVCDWKNFAKDKVPDLYDLAAIKYPEITNTQELDEQVWADLIKLVDLVLNRAPQHNPLNKKIIGVEEPFLLDIGKGIKIKGFIDLLLELDDETVEVHDWKSGTWTLSYKDAQKDPQVRMYDLATRILYPKYKYILVTLDYIQRRPITVSLTDKHADGTRRALERHWRRIHNTDMPRRIESPNWICKYLCDREKCDKLWEDFMAGRELVCHEQ